MKSIIVLATLAALGVLSTGPGAVAEVPTIVNYQGRLCDTQGVPIYDDSYAITFRIYDGTGTLLWLEAHDVETTDGLFTVYLGSAGSPLTPSVLDYTECWLGITIRDESEIVPRTRLLAVPYAHLARSAADASTLQGQAPESFAPVTHTHDADQIASGTLSNFRFSASSDLASEGYLDGQDNFDLMNRIQCDIRYAGIVHSHTGAEVYGALNNGGYLNNNSTGDLLTQSQLDGRFSNLAHSHTPSPIQCKFQYHVANLSGSVMADGIINADGTSAAGGPLNDVYWDATYDRYVLNFTLSGFSINTHVVKITPIANQGYFATVGQAPPDDLVVYIWRP